MNLNKVLLVGRVTQDPQIKYTNTGTPLCRFGLATNRVYLDKETKQRKEIPEYHNIVLWRRLAEIASQYLRKGSLVLIEGRLNTRKWEKTPGQMNFRTEIIGERMQLGPKSARESASFEDIPIIEEENEEELKVEDIPL